MITSQGSRLAILQRLSIDTSCLSPETNDALHSADADASVICNLVGLEGQRKVADEFLLCWWDIPIVRHGDR